jgi:hypothetical protein
VWFSAAARLSASWGTAIHSANHAPDENMTLDCFHGGIRTGAALLQALGEME